MKYLKITILGISIIGLMHSCTIEKRRYCKGFYIEKNSVFKSDTKKKDNLAGSNFEQNSNTIDSSFNQENEVAQEIANQFKIDSLSMIATKIESPIETNVEVKVLSKVKRVINEKVITQRKEKNQPTVFKQIASKNVMQPISNRSFSSKSETKKVTKTNGDGDFWYSGWGVFTIVMLSLIGLLLILLFVSFQFGIPFLIVLKYFGYGVLGVLFLYLALLIMYVTLAGILYVLTLTFINGFENPPIIFWFLETY